MENAKPAPTPEAPKKFYCVKCGIEKGEEYHWCYDCFLRWSGWKYAPLAPTPKCMILDD